MRTLACPLRAYGQEGVLCREGSTLRGISWWVFRRTSWSQWHLPEIIILASCPLQARQDTVVMQAPPLRGPSSDKPGLVYLSAVEHSETRAGNRRVQRLPPRHHCNAGSESERRRAACTVPDCGASTARAGPGGEGLCRAGLPTASDRVSSCLWLALLRPCQCASCLYPPHLQRAVVIQP